MINAQCHCGNIELFADYIPDTLTQCNCSICRKLATKWIYYKSSEVKVTYKNRPTQTYIWGDKCIAFHHCPICGCATHYTSVPDSNFDRIAINANMLELKLIESLKIRRFNGAEM
ncbi:MAG: GFA family protein [Marinicellaceae bacterium]